MENQYMGSSSCSWSVNEVMEGSHRYMVKGYSLVKGMGSSKYLSSDVFSVGGYDWAIYFYPDGLVAEDNSTYISVFLALKKGGDARAVYDFIMSDQSGNGQHKIYGRSREPSKFTSNNQESSWGFEKFYRRSDLESSRFLKDDCIQIICKVGVVMKTRNERPNDFSINVPPSDLGSCLKSFFQSSIGFDITFEVGDQTFQAHKQILAARSPVFRAQFFGSIGDPYINKIVVEEIAHIFKAMLSFIYSDSLSDLLEIREKTLSGSATMFFQNLLAAADRYGLDRLKLVCEEKLSKEVKIDNAATTLALAEQHNCQRLKTLCLKFTTSSNNLGGVMQSEGYEYLKEHFPAVLGDILQIVAANGGLLNRK